MWDIVAILASPLIAFWVGKLVSDHAAQRERRHRLFESLWLTQHLGIYGRMSPEHVRALNMVEIEFARTKGDEVWDDGASNRVLAAWASYHNHLNVQRPLVTDAENPDPAELAAASEWDQANDISLRNLLHEMAQALGYKHSDRERTERGSYAPIGYANADLENIALRNAALELLNGKRPLPVMTMPLISSTQAQAATVPTLAQPALPETAPYTMSAPTDALKVPA